MSQAADCLQVLLYPAMEPLTSKDSAVSTMHNSERCHEYNPTNLQPCRILDAPFEEGWANSSALIAGEEF